jgi:MFS family permease
VLCAGVLMIVLDTTIVNVALPSIREDLRFTETSLVWVVNAYMLTFGGFLLLGGRLGDLFGHRRLFLLGVTLFTLASLACGAASSQGMLIVARAAQGVAGAVVSAVALSLIMDLFTEPAERAKAMGIYGFVCSAGGSVGVLLGGMLTSAFSWHWIFLVNLPIGIAVYACCRALLPDVRGTPVGAKVDVAGAVTVTAALMLAVYAIVDGNDIVEWVARRLDGREKAMMVLDGKAIPEEWEKDEAMRVFRVAVLCTSRTPAMRPSMRSVVQMLEDAVVGGRDYAASGKAVEVKIAIP